MRVLVAAGVLLLCAQSGETRAAETVISWSHLDPRKWSDPLGRIGLEGAATGVRDYLALDWRPLVNDLVEVRADVAPGEALQVAHIRVRWFPRSKTIDLAQATVFQQRHSPEFLRPHWNNLSWDVLLEYQSEYLGDEPHPVPFLFGRGIGGVTWHIPANGFASLLPFGAQLGVAWPPDGDGAGDGDGHAEAVFTTHSRLDISLAPLPKIRAFGSASYEYWVCAGEHRSIGRLKLEVAFRPKKYWEFRWSLGTVNMNNIMTFSVYADNILHSPQSAQGKGHQ